MQEMKVYLEKAGEGLLTVFFAFFHYVTVLALLAAGHRFFSL
jgi:hypothetical protein